MAPGEAFHYTLIDEVIEGSLRPLKRLGNGLFVVTLLALTLAALGIYAIAAHSVQLRTIEVGIRKVLGATTNNISRLLCWDLLKPVALGVIIALPVTWVVLNYLLQHSPIGLELNAMPFLVATAIVLAVNMLTIYGHTQSMGQNRSGPVVEVVNAAAKLADYAAARLIRPTQARQYRQPCIGQTFT